MKSRAYASDADFAAMRRLVVESWRIAGAHFEWTPGDLAWRRYRFPNFEPSSAIRLFEDSSGDLAAFVWFMPRTGFDVAVHPERQTEAVYEHVIDTILREYPENLAQPIWAMESSAKFAAALATKHYARTGAGYVHHTRSLERPLVLTPPPGFDLRAVRGLEECDARAGAQRRAFQTNRVTNESYRCLMNARDYDASFDCVAVEAASGTIVAFALGWLDAMNQTGELEPVGTDPSFRRRGLARAVSAHALDVLRARGAKTAIVYAAEEDESSRTLYGSLGFEVVDRNLGWRRISENP